MPDIGSHLKIYWKYIIYLVHMDCLHTPSTPCNGYMGLNKVTIQDKPKLPLTIAAEPADERYPFVKCSNVEQTNEQIDTSPLGWQHLSSPCIITVQNLEGRYILDIGKGAPLRDSLSQER